VGDRSSSCTSYRMGHRSSTPCLCLALSPNRNGSRICDFPSQFFQDFLPLFIFPSRVLLMPSLPSLLTFKLVSTQTHPGAAVAADSGIEVVASAAGAGAVAVGDVAVAVAGADC
jgi:hypothetical protein